MSRGLVGIIANDAARFSEFMACVTYLDLPDGWDKHILIGGDWCGARNDLARMCLDEGYSHLWFMDDDHAFAPDLLKRLLAWDAPLVNPMCLTRTYPFVPVTYTEEVDAANGKYLPIDFEGAPGEGLIRLVAAGCAGMLIHRDVLEATNGLSQYGDQMEPYQWFEYTNRSEDIVFCEKAKAAGFELWGDLGARLGHITTAVVWPSYDAENGWATGLVVGKDMQLIVPYAAQLVAQLEPTGETEPMPPDSPVAAAERIEIWMDDEMMWWWRAVKEDDGQIVGMGSAINEPTVIAAALAQYPDSMIFQIAREIDDSRLTEQYGPPKRLWNRGQG